jgi:hypothetical protein
LPFTVTVKAVERISGGTGAACTRLAAWAASGSARKATSNRRKPSKKTGSGKKVEMKPL